MNYYFLSIIASIFVILGYIPEFYTIITCKKKDVGNIYIWLIWTTGNVFSIAYCVMISEYYIMATNIIILFMNFSVFMLKYYYLYIYQEEYIPQIDVV